MDSIFLVSIRCHTFNHASYIEESLNGFTMQKTTFPFVCIIMDDASTDGGAEVINSYMQTHFDYDDKKSVRNEETDDYKMTFARHKINKNCYFVVYYLKYNHYQIKKSKNIYLSKWIDNAKYQAICEGDDKWIDPLKLERQVQILEKHPECNIAYCKVQKINKNGRYLIGQTIPYKGAIKPGIVSLADYCKEEFYVGHWCFHTSSFVYRTDPLVLKKQEELFASKFPYGDMPIQLWRLLHGKGYYLDFIGSCYRLFSGGYNYRVRSNSSFGISQEKKLIEALQYFDELTDLKYHKEIKRKILRSNLKIEKYQGKAYLVFCPKYWALLREMTILKIIGSLICVINPSWYRGLKYYCYKRRVNENKK